MKFAVVVFPGSNSDRDAFHAAGAVLGEQASLVWHKDTDLGGADAVILPGGFAHGEGNYFAEPDQIDALERNRQVVFRYVDERGQMAAGTNPNGSVNGIAGICNAARNVVGLMPHPERACEPWMGSADGLAVLSSVVKACAEGLAARRQALIG